MDTRTDQVLFTCIQAGDKQAFMTLMMRHQSTIRALCYRYLKSNEADDIVQKTFIRAFIHTSSLSPDTSILAWLIVVARRLCIDRLRFYKRRPEATEILEKLILPDKSNEDLVIEKQTLEKLKNELFKLAEGPREAVVLYYIHDMSYHDISVALEVPIGTVMTWLHRAKKDLKRMLQASDCVQVKETHP